MSKVIVEKYGRVTLIKINRPEQMNALDIEANEEMKVALNAFDADDGAQIAVITGAGDKAFCAGADLKDFSLQIGTKPAPWFRENYNDAQGFGGVTRNFECNKPILAAINGYCLSGGLEIALATDIRFCSEEAEFGLQDVQWGFHSGDGGGIRLPLTIGLGNAFDLMLSGKRINAEHALRIGLVNRVYPTAEVLEKTLDYAQILATRAPLGQRYAKEVMRRTVHMNMDEALRLEVRSFHDLSQTEDLVEGVAAFAEKRSAAFKGC